MCESIKAVAANHEEWAKEYEYNPKINEFIHNKAVNAEKEMVAKWFE